MLSIRTESNGKDVEMEAKLDINSPSAPRKEKGGRRGDSSGIDDVTRWRRKRHFFVCVCV